MSPSVEIPDVPTGGPQVEEYVAALFQTAGYYVEQQITEIHRAESGNLQVLEIDVVATQYEALPPRPVIVEAKWGDWGLADLFKLLGWMTYLGQRPGVFIAMKQMPGRDVAEINKKFAPHALSVIVLGDCSDAPARFEAAGLGRLHSTDALSGWRWVNMMRRLLVNQIRTAITENTCPAGARTAIDYHKLINDEVFFEREPRTRLYKMYSAFSNHPKLSLAVANELVGGNFNAVPSDAAHNLFKQAMLDGDHPLLQACFYVEHRARVAIIKAAIDNLAAGEPPPKTWRLKTPDGPMDIVIDPLPSSFHRAFDTLKREPFFPRYALFWQAFLWGWGGFYLESRKYVEFAALSAETGIPVEHIPNALRSYDLLFPLDSGSWMLGSTTYTDCVIMKMFPAPLRGLGAHRRRAFYTIDEFSQLGYSDYTVADLTRWLMRGYKLLATELPEIAGAKV